MADGTQISSLLLIQMSLVFLGLFSVIGAFDGIYFHLIKYQLHKFPASRLEHQIHTLRAFLFVPIVYFLFARNSVGLDLWIGIGFVVIDLIAEIFDVLVEKKSRETLGGVSPVEALVHILATSCRVCAILLILVTKDSLSFSLQYSGVGEMDYPVSLKLFSYGFIFVSLIGGATQVLGMLPSQRKPILRDNLRPAV